MTLPISLQDAIELQKRFTQLREQNAFLLAQANYFERELKTANQAIDVLQGKYDTLKTAAQNALDALRAMQLHGPLEPGAVDGAVNSLTKALGVKP